MKTNSRRIISLLLVVFILISLAYYFFSIKTPLYIAVTGPLKNERGVSLVNGVKLYIEEVNKSNPIPGKELKMIVFDDEDNALIAEKKAIDAVKSKAVAVIGHVSSPCSLSGRSVYMKKGLPAITPYSTDNKLSEYSDKEKVWYFRTIFNNELQAKFLAFYIREVLKYKNAYIISEDAEHSSGIAESFNEVAGGIDLKVRRRWIYQVKDRNLDSSLLRIVNELKREISQGAVFIGAHRKEGVKLIRLIRDAGIKRSVFGPTAFATTSFLNEFNGFNKEKSIPGFYTNGVYAGVPLTFDAASEKAQIFKRSFIDRFDKKPDWQAAYAYDTAMVLVKAIRKTLEKGDERDIGKFRSKLRDSLTGINRKNALTGTSGLNYFDKNGDCHKSMYIGVYRDRNIVSPHVQLQLVPERKGTSDKTILSHRGNSIIATNVVYTGIEINNITGFDNKSPTSEIDFYIWFRHRGDIELNDIMFTNMINPVKFKEEKNDSRINLVRDERSSYLQSCLYRVRAPFIKLRGESKDIIENSSTIGFSLRHDTYDSRKLIFVTDVRGMGIADRKTFMESLNDNILAAGHEWKISGAKCYPDKVKVSTRGDLAYLNLKDRFVNFSIFSSRITVKKDNFSIRRKLSVSDSRFLAFLSLGILIFTFLLNIRREIKHKRILWAVNMLLSLLFVTSSESALIKLIPENDLEMIKTVIILYDILWFIFPAYYLNRALTPFVWEPVESKTGYETPDVLKKFPPYIIYFVAVYGIVIFVFELDITKILATSGMAAMITGFLVKDTITGYFSSLSVIQGYELKTGEWIQVEGFDEGRVLNVTRFMTRIRTRDGSLLNIPNKVLLDRSIKNYGKKEVVYWQKLSLSIITEKSEDDISRILKKVLMETEGVISNPEPYIKVGDINDSFCEFNIWYAVEDFEKRDFFEEKILKGIKSVLDEEGVRTVTPNKIINVEHT